VREFQNAEDAKEQSFNSRAAGLTGFVGIVVTLASGAGKLTVDEGIDGFAAIAAGAAFTLALVGLALAIGMAVVKVLIPPESSGDPKYEGAPVFGGRRPFALFSLRLTRRRAGDEPIAGGGKRLYSNERVPNGRGYGRVSRRGPG
jgi:hypothetical protein